MQNYIKKIVLFSLAAGLIFSFSCDKNTEIEDRTFNDELAELDSLLNRKIAAGYDIDTTELGVFYIIQELGDGPFPQRGDTCAIDFRAFFINGDLFDTSNNLYPGGIWQFLYGEPDMIPGLESGIGHMNEGAKIEMMIPSNLAFGKTGAGNIPPYTTLIYISKMHHLGVVDD